MEKMKRLGGEEVNVVEEVGRVHGDRGSAAAVVKVALGEVAILGSGGLAGRARLPRVGGGPDNVGIGDGTGAVDQHSPEVTGVAGDNPRRSEVDRRREFGRGPTGDGVDRADRGSAGDLQFIDGAGCQRGTEVGRRILPRGGRNGGRGGTCGGSGPPAADERPR